MMNYLKKQYTAYKKRGFTLIELIVVMSIIAVLVLLAAPKFVGQTEKAHVAQIKNDVRVVESKVGEYLIEHGDLTKWGAPIDALDGDELYNKRGLIDSDNPITEGPFRVVPEEVLEEVKSHLDGTFYSNDLGVVYYSKEEFIGSPSYTDEEIDDKIKLGYIPIATAEELDSIRSNTTRTYGEGTDWEKEYTGGLDKNYVQVANIDLSEYSEEGWSPIGTLDLSAVSESDMSDMFDASFTGAYDGGNYIITGLEVKGEDKHLQGLFGLTQGAAIRNVGLIDNKVTGTSYVGGLVGWAFNSTIENSYATGSVEGTGAVGGLVGGLVSNASSSTISNSYATGSVEGAGFVGGLVGSAYELTISNSYATGSVESTGSRTTDSTGGLVGYAFNSTIDNSYATGSVEGTGNDVGGLVGYTISGTKISNSYWDTKTTGQSKSAGGTGKTTEEMKKKDTYSGWDFESVWKIDEGKDYPKLR